jgi:hypothetical protein
MSCDENAGHYHNIKMGNKSFERMAKFKHLGTILNKSNCINEEIQSRIKKTECILSVDPETFVFPFAIQTYEDKNTQN